MKTMTREEILSILNTELPNDIKEKYSTAFNSIAKQSYYCIFHVEEFERFCKLHAIAMRGISPFDSKYPPEAHRSRIGFEANAFGFFRSLHALVDSIPYMLNIGLEIDIKNTEKVINWGTIKRYCREQEFDEGLEAIEDLLNDPEYIGLNNLVNITKHRRLPTIDSGVYTKDEQDVIRSVRFYYESDFCVKLRTYVIYDLMEITYNALHPKIFNVSSVFVNHKTSKRLPPKGLV